MRIAFLSTLSIVLLIGPAAIGQNPSGTGQPQSRQPVPGSAPTGALAGRYGFAVVDVSYIFKNHQRFKSMMEAMKKDVQAAEGILKEERVLIAKDEEGLQQYNAGSSEYKELDQQLATKKADFQVKATQQRKEFLDREAKIYFQTWLEVNDAVKYYAQRHKIGLVVRFNGDPIDPNRREDVLRAINRPVVYQNGIDITPDVLQELNRGGSGKISLRPNGGNINSTSIPGRPPR